MKTSEEQRNIRGYLLTCLSASLSASVADISTHPLEVAKVRLQVQQLLGNEAKHVVYNPSIHKPVGTSSRLNSGVSTRGLSIHQPWESYVATAKYRGLFRTIYTICSEEGPAALYNGLTSGVIRQMCYSAIRLGCYDHVKEFYISLFDDGHSVQISSFNVGLRILAAATTCSTAVILTHPMDVIKTRMQAMQTGPHVKARYVNIRHAYTSIARNEGIRGLWGGTFPSLSRNCIITSAELVSYDVIKEQILKWQLMADNIYCHFVTAFATGAIATVASSPIDVIKSRVVNSPRGTYRGSFHCAKLMFKREGFLSFYKGFIPYYARVGSWSIVMFISYEQLRKYYS